MSDGWDVVLATAGGKVTQLKAIEAEAKAAQAAITQTQQQTVMMSSQPTGKRASGGPVEAGGTYLVGEQGPELFSPASGGTILPNHTLTTAGSGGGGAQPVTVNVMQGAVVTVTGQGDEKRLARSVAQELARVIQAQRTGLATTM